jgi:hypothetical protein
MRRFDASVNHPSSSISGATHPIDTPLKKLSKQSISVSGATHPIDTTGLTVYTSALSEVDGELH